MRYSGTDSPILSYRQERVLFSTDFNLFKRRTEKIKVSLSVYDSAEMCIRDRPKSINKSKISTKVISEPIKLEFF